jgi:hypothetical protein
MNIVGKKQKKVVSQETKRKRMKIILCILLFMFIFVIIFAPRSSKTKKNLSSVETKMDAQLDSMLASIHCAQATIYYKGELEDVKIMPPIPEEDTLYTLKDILNKEIKRASIGIPTDESTIQAQKMKIAYLENKINIYKNDTRNVLRYDSRRIRFKTKEGIKYTCFQNLSKDDKKCNLSFITRLDEKLKDNN